MATPLYSYVEPWHWDTDNDGYATAEETTQSYSALINKSYTNLFLRKVWNDMVLTTAYFRQMTGRSWITTYGTESMSYMNDTQAQLTANRFNALVVNVGYPYYSWQFNPILESYVGRETFKGIAAVTANYADIVYASYLIEVMQKLNILIAVCNGNKERVELFWYEHRTCNVHSDAVALPSAPIAYNLLIESDIESHTELTIIEPSALRVQHTDTLEFSCVMSCIISGLARVELQAELFYIDKLLPLPTKRLSYVGAIKQSQIATLVYLSPFSDWAIACQICESSYEAEMVALPAAECEYCELIPDIPSVAILDTKRTVAMDVLLRMPGIFDFEMTVLRGYALEMSFDAASISVLAALEHGMFSYMSGPSFFAMAYSTVLDLQAAAECSYNDTIAELKFVDNLELISATILEAHVAFEDFYINRGGRGISVPVEADIVYSYAYEARLEKYNRPLDVFANLEDWLLYYGVLETTDLLFSIPTLLQTLSLSADADLQLFNNAITIEALMSCINEAKADILFVAPYKMQCKAQASIECTADLFLLDAVLLDSVSICGQMHYLAKANIEGAAWLYPIRTDNDLYIRQAVKIEKQGSSLLLDAKSIYTNAIVFLDFDTAATLDAFSSFATHELHVLSFITDIYLSDGLMLDITGSLNISAELDVCVPYQPPIVHGNNIYIQQAHHAETISNTLYVADSPIPAFIDVNLETKLVLGAIFDAYNSLLVRVNISFIHEASLDVFNGLQISSLFTGSFAANLTYAKLWTLPIIRGNNIYISSVYSADSSNDDLEVT